MLSLVRMLASAAMESDRYPRNLKYLAQYLVWAYGAKSDREVVLKAQVLAIMIRQAKYLSFKEK